MLGLYFKLFVLFLLWASNPEGSSSSFPGATAYLFLLFRAYNYYSVADKSWMCFPHQWTISDDCIHRCVQALCLNVSGAGVSWMVLFCIGSLMKVFLFYGLSSHVMWKCHLLHYHSFQNRACLKAYQLGLFTSVRICTLTDKYVCSMEVNMCRGIILPKDSL